MNIGVGRAAGVLNKHEGRVTNLLSTTSPRPASTILVGETRFVIEELQLHGDVLLFFETGPFDALVAAVNRTIAIDSLSRRPPFGDVNDNTP